MEKHIKLLEQLLEYWWTYGYSNNQWNLLNENHQQFYINYYIYDYLKYGTPFKAARRFV